MLNIFIFTPFCEKLYISYTLLQLILVVLRCLNKNTLINIPTLTRYYIEVRSLCRSILRVL